MTDTEMAKGEVEVLRARGGTVISFASCSSVDALERESNANTAELGRPVPTSFCFFAGRGCASSWSGGINTAEDVYVSGLIMVTNNGRGFSKKRRGENYDLVLLLSCF